MRDFQPLNVFHKLSTASFEAKELAKRELHELVPANAANRGDQVRNAEVLYSRKTAADSSNC